MTAESSQTLSIFSYRSYTYFWIARSCGQLALQMQAVAIGWQVYDLTRNPLHLGLVGLAQFSATLLFALVAGQVVDRYDRRNVMRAAQAVICIAMALLFCANAFGWLRLPVVLGLVFVIGAARAFEQPSAQSLIPALVPAPVLSRAIAAASSASQTAIIAGPALGGLLYIVSPAAVYGLAAAFYATAFMLLSLIVLERAPPRKEPLSLPVVLAGVSFIRRNPLILGAITLDLFAVLLGGATALLPVFARDVFALDASGLGLLRLCPAIGALSASLVLARMPIKHHAGKIMLGAVTVFGLATIVFGLSTWLPLSLAALAALGAADLVSVVVRMTLIQIATPDHMRGRVSAVNSLFIGTSNQLGEFESGATAALFGAEAAVVLGGIGTLLVVAACWRLFPSLAAVDSMQDLPAQIASEEPVPHKFGA